MRTLNIEESIVDQVVVALATRAKYYDKLIDDASGVPDPPHELMPEWAVVSEKLWALIRSIGEKPNG